MYNLLVNFLDGAADRTRVVEYTEEAVLQYIAPSGSVDPVRLVHLPTLIVPERGNTQVPQVARVGHIEDLTVSPKSYRFRFVENPAVPAIATSRIQQIADRLSILDWEFQRTHWAVKDVDLYRVLHELGQVKLSPRVWRLPIESPRDERLVAVMMPFDARFDPVYEALKEAVTAAGLECHRADDIWKHDHVMDDVIDLIWRAQVVVSDLSERNANVFYETGIAHALGRDVIQIVQHFVDVPFDLQSIRTVAYLPNGEGLADMKRKVTARLNDLVAAARRV